MNSSILQKSVNPFSKGSEEINPCTCTKCGGNGYTKSTPNCYKTCLECYGLGYVVPFQK